MAFLVSERRLNILIPLRISSQQFAAEPLRQDDTELASIHNRPGYYYNYLHLLLIKTDTEKHDYKP